MRGQTFVDVNATARQVRRSGPTIPGARAANTRQDTMHAEFGAMFQAYEAGLRGDHGVLVIQGMMACPYCKGDVKTLARSLQLDSLTVHDANGAIILGEVLEKKGDLILQWRSRTSFVDLQQQRGLSYTFLVGEKHVPAEEWGNADAGDGPLDRQVAVGAERGRFRGAAARAQVGERP